MQAERWKQIEDLYQAALARPRMPDDDGDVFANE
jgi:hypothetical protein